MDYRVIVTGSRDWPYPGFVQSILHDHYDALPDAVNFVVVHGGCPTGADATASRWAQGMIHGGVKNVVEECHPADWNVYGKSAGPIRNEYMVDLGADVCLAFIYNSSRGATHCADTADLAAIRTIRHIIKE